MIGRRFGAYGRRRAIQQVMAGALASLDLGTETFTRPTVATWWDGTTLTSYAINVLREPIASFIALEGSSTNELPLSERFSDWPTMSGVTITDDNETGPDGTSTDASTIDSTSNTLSFQRNTNWEQSVERFHTFSVFMNGVAGGESVVLRLLDEAGNIHESFPTLTASWARYRVSANCTGTGGAEYAQMRQDGTTNDYGAFGAQVEPRAFFTSYVGPTNLSTLTRDADSLIVSAPPSFLLSGKYQFSIRPNGSSTDIVNDANDETLIGFSGGTSFLRIIDDTGIKVRLTDGTNTTTTGAITFSEEQQITITVDMPTGDITIAGATTGNGTTSGSGAVTFPAATACRIGADHAGTLPYFGLFSRTISEVT